MHVEIAASIVQMDQLIIGAWLRGRLPCREGYAEAASRAENPSGMVRKTEHEHHARISPSFEAKASCSRASLKLSGVSRLKLGTLARELKCLPAVTSLEPLDTTDGGGGGTSLTISDCAEILVDAHLGDSISVNGRAIPKYSL
jgi:hypothetical protein